MRACLSKNPSRFLWNLLLGPALLGLALLPAPASAQPSEEPAPADTAVADTASTDEDGFNVSIDLSDNDDHISVLDGKVTHTADHVRFGESVHIKKGERVLGDVVAIGGSVDVDGEVMGDAVAIMGSVGLGEGAVVHGEVVSVGGSVTLDDSARVSGDAVSVGGRLELSESAVVEGQGQEVGGFGLHIPKFGGFRASERERPFKFLSRVIWVLILTAIGLGIFRVFPGRMRNLADTVQHRGFVAFLAGFAGWILWLPIFIILCVTLIGIPVALLLIFMTPVMCLFGYLAVAEVAGKRLSGALHKPESILRHMFLGVLILEGLLLLSKVLAIMGSVFEFFGFIVGMIGWCIVFVAGTIGFGAFLMTRFRPLRPRVVSIGPSGSAPGPPMSPAAPAPPSWSPPPAPPPPPTPGF